MDVGKYSEFLLSYDFDGLEKIKQKSIPEKLYKYIPLGLSLLEDEKRLKTLESASLWFSPVAEYNDTNEFQGLYINDRRLAEKGYSPECISGVHEVVETIGGNALACCLSSVGYDNEPMWAYYANDSKGFCVEFKVDNPQYLREVQYESCAHEITSIAANLYRNVLCGRKPYRLSPEDKVAFELISMRSQIKHSSWSHEKEYRYVIPVEFSEGVSVPISMLGLSIGSVYSGVRCAKGNLEHIYSIGEELGFTVKKLKPFDLGFRASYKEETAIRERERSGELA